jgi:hypothetical protein
MVMSRSWIVVSDRRVWGFLERVECELPGGVVAKGHRNEVFRNDKQRRGKLVFGGDSKGLGLLEEANVETDEPVGQHEVWNARRLQERLSDF